MTKTTTTEKTATTTNNDESENPAEAGGSTVLLPAPPNTPRRFTPSLSLSHTPEIPHIMTIASPVVNATTASNTTNTTTTTTTTEKDGTEAGEGIITPPRYQSSTKRERTIPVAAAADKGWHSSVGAKIINIAFFVM